MEKEFAKIPDRFLAYLIDTIPFGAGYYVGLRLLIVRWDVLPDTREVRVLSLLGWLVLYVLYHAVGNALGAGLGKRLMGIRVVGADGGRLGISRSLIRAVGLLASAPLNLGFLWALAHPESRTWHDLLASSWVVESRPRTPGGRLFSALAAFAALGTLLGVTVWLHLIRPTPGDLAAVGKAREGLNILARVEEDYRARHGTYTGRLAELAAASGDAEGFKSAMRDLFDPRGFHISAGKNDYRFRARAKDRRRTVVTLAGPQR